MLYDWWNMYKNKTTIPIIYVLIVNQTTNSHNEMSQVLKNNNQNLSPCFIIIGFEKAFATGCYFHFQQWWKSKKMVYRLYIPKMLNSHHNLQVRHLAALAFVPTNKVINYFEKLVDSTYFVENDNSLSMYFEDTFNT